MWLHKTELGNYMDVVREFEKLARALKSEKGVNLSVWLSPQREKARLDGRHHYSYSTMLLLFQFLCVRVPLTIAHSNIFTLVLVCSVIFSLLLCAFPRERKKKGKREPGARMSDLEVKDSHGMCNAMFSACVFKFFLHGLVVHC